MRGADAAGWGVRLFGGAQLFDPDRQDRGEVAAAFPAAAVDLVSCFVSGVAA